MTDKGLDADISSIAEQTNLLALNATIEAARAGEAGKGFAVVATEVKDLAQETAKATEEISRKIAAIQASSGEAAQALSEITGIVEQINEHQMTVASAVEEQTATPQEITRSVDQAATGMDHIARSVTDVSHAAGSPTPVQCRRPGQRSSWPTWPVAWTGRSRTSASESARRVGWPLHQVLEDANRGPEAKPIVDGGPRVRTRQADLATDCRCETAASPR
nr:hypothetical protein GCM10020093_021040 [Planobispora longispora]